MRILFMNNTNLKSSEITKNSTKSSVLFKFSKTYKNPIKKSNIVSAFEEDTQKNEKNLKNNEKIDLLVFDGKKLENDKNLQNGPVPVIISQPNSNKLYDKINLIENGMIETKLNDTNSKKGYNHNDYVEEINTLPLHSKIEDYESMPISDFGKAMLRGMGWSEGSSIGKTNKGLVEPIEYIPRTKGLGLGAQSRLEYIEGKIIKNKRVENNLEKSDKNYKNKPGKSYRYISDNNKNFKTKSTEYCLIKFGEWEGNYVQVVKRVKDSESCIVKWNNYNQQKMETIPIKNLTFVSEEEFILNSKKNEKFETEKKIKKWIIPNLYVRISSRLYQDGKYYKQKGKILDVYNSENNKYCDLLTDNSEKLTRVNENYLESIIPKDEENCVIVLYGKYKNKKGHVISKNKNIAQVQLIDDDLIVSFDLDHICQIFLH